MGCSVLTAPTTLWQELSQSTTTDACRLLREWPAEISFYLGWARVRFSRWVGLGDRVPLVGRNMWSRPGFFRGMWPLRSRAPTSARYAHPEPRGRSEALRGQAEDAQRMFRERSEAL